MGEKYWSEVRFNVDGHCFQCTQPGLTTQGPFVAFLLHGHLRKGQVQSFILEFRQVTWLE